MPEPTTDHAPCRPAISPVRAYVAAALLGAVALGLTSLHAHQAQRHALTKLATAWGQAGQALESEAKAGELTARIRALSADLERHHDLRSSIDLSAVTATLVNRLPETATLDRLSLTVDDAVGGRVLRGDAAGFAPALADLERFAARLADTPPFDDVRLEERLRHTRVVDGAVGFAVTFRIDLGGARRILTAGAEVAR